jgi:DNA processing protein
MDETAAVVALVRHTSRDRIRTGATGGARDQLEREHGLLAQQLVEEAMLELEQWRRQGIRVLTPTASDYPENLRTVDDRPPLLFVAGRLERRDMRSVAVVGSRRPSAGGLATARGIARHLVSRGYTVVSGLATGIDAAAHTAALEARGRTIAAIGTGLSVCYPPQNRALQQRIAGDGVVVSQFWPDAPPTRQSFPLRNAVMASLSLASVIVEAGPTSGARTEARFALSHGRPVILLPSLLEQEWACEMAQRPGTYVAQTPAQVLSLVDRLTEESLAA